jgi:imidazolonepropionase
VRVVTFYLGAHAVPAEYKDRADAYIDEVCIPGLEAAHAEGLGRCGRRFLRRHRLFTRPRSRACSTRPGRLACRSSCTPSSCPIWAAQSWRPEYGALSADHLEYLDEAASSHGESRHGGRHPARRLLHVARDAAPPVDAFSQAGVPMALATDCNPGSSPMTSLLLDA